MVAVVERQLSPHSLDPMQEKVVVVEVEVEVPALVKTLQLEI